MLKSGLDAESLSRLWGLCSSIPSRCRSLLAVTTRRGTKTFSFVYAAPLRICFRGRLSTLWIMFDVE
jgi:hypothetical protein